MRKLFNRLILCLLIGSILLAGCGKTEEPLPDYRVVIATDIHYLSPSLTDYGPIFQRLMEAGDGKVTEYCEQIVDAFLEEMAELRPDAVILTGDLSFNGERESHEELARKLAEAEASGVPVLVLPGNHDLYRSGTYSYFGEKAEPVLSITAEEFREIYASFGFNEALSADPDSLSYVAQLNSETRVLMLDANTLHNFCGFSEKTLSWVESQLKEAAEDGQTVLAACHQNLFQHSMFGAGYVLNQSEKLQALLETYQVRVFLSGHLHIQHIQCEGSITEIATSALTMGACQYGLLEAKGDSVRYETRPVDMASWALRHGKEEEPFTNFSDYAFSSMETRTRSQAIQQLMALGYDEEEIQAMTDFAWALNKGYFSGDLSEIPKLDPESRLLERWRESGTFFGLYFASFEKEIGVDHTHWNSTA